MALQFNQKEVSESGNCFLEAIRYAPTVFPIVLAAVIGRLMKVVALWRCENGASLGLLEQLVGSQSLASTIERFFILRRFKALSVTIVLLWLLSPLGGQMTLRVLTTTIVEHISQSELTYFNTTTIYGARSLSRPYDSAGSAFSGARAMNFSRHGLTALVGASVLSSESVRQSPVDQWNNIKFPCLNESVEQSDGAGDLWMPVEDITDKTWASLSGLTVQGLPADANSTFSVESSYIDVVCFDGFAFHYRPDIINTSQFLQGYGLTGLAINLSSPYGEYPNRATSFLDSRTTRDEFYNHSSINLIYGSRLAVGPNNETASNETWLYMYDCTITTPRIEGHVVCNGKSCAMTQIRRSQRDLTSPNIPPFSFVQYTSLLRFIPGALGYPHRDGPSPIDWYMLGADNPFSPFEFVAQNWSQIPGKVFGKRLTILVNTAWQIGLGPHDVSLDTSANSFLDGMIPSANTNATVSRNIQRYTAHRNYIGLSMAITLILLACAIAGLFLNFVTKAPDILGYVSTMTRDNPYVQVPVGGSTLDGVERARYLADMRVRLGDVRPRESFGYVALQSIGDFGDGSVGRLEISRLYL